MTVFIDSNVAVYSVTENEPAKQAVAERLISTLLDSRRLTVSTQVLQETFNVLTRKMRFPAAPALEFVELLARARVVPSNADFVQRSLSLSVDARLCVWDALIVQAALDGGCTTLYSEDLQAGRRFGDLQVVNPFTSAVHEPLPEYSPRKRPRANASRQAAA
jgi:predicted nucleic acid-binding protein